MRIPEKTSRSLGMLILSMVAFGTIGIFRRSIPLPSGLIAFFRGIIGSLFLAAWVKLRGGKLRHGIGGRRTALLILSGAAIGFNWILLFEAYSYTTVSIATLCYYTQPILVILASAALFGERLTFKKGLCAAMALAGMVLISGLTEGGGQASANLRGILFGLGAAALYAAVVLLNRFVSGVDVYEKTVIQLFSAGAVMIPYCLARGEFAGFAPDGRTVLLLAVVGIVYTGICYALYFASMEGLPMQTVAIFSYVDPLTALLLAALVLGEKMSVWGVVGAALILGSAVWTETDRIPAGPPPEGKGRPGR